MSQALLVAMFGSSAELDGYFLALILPGFLAVPLAASSELAFGPGMARTADRRRYAVLILRYAAVRGAVIAGGATLIAPVGVYVSTLGRLGQGDEAVELARILYPTVLPIAIIASCSALLISLGRIVTPIVVQIVRPASMIVALVVVESPSIKLLAFVTLASACLEALISLALLFRQVSRRPAADSTTAHSAETEFAQATRTSRSLIAPYVVNQVTPLVDQAFVANLGPGLLVRYVLAVRLYDVAKGFLITPLVRLGQNALATQHRLIDLGPAMRHHTRRIGIGGFISGTAAAALGPIVLVVGFTNGEFTVGDAWATARILLVLATSLPFFSLQTFLIRALVVQGATATARKALVLFAIVSICLNVVLAPVFGAVGVALATSISHGLGVLFCRRSLNASDSLRPSDG